MDPFTQRILDRAEQRSKLHGISNPVAKVPLGDNSAETSLSSVGSSAKSPVVRKGSSVEQRSSDGKNVLTYTASTSGGSSTNDFDNFSVEINITTDTNVGVKCDVTALDVDGEGNVLKTTEMLSESTNSSGIRDASKSRLQRLGALYSDEQISSPIHRTEGNFHEKMGENCGPPKPKNRFGKLAALADSINRWEDEDKVAQKENLQAPATASPSKSTGTIPKRPQVVETIPKKTPTKQLKWDQSVMEALECQGFKRRESTKKLTYEYRENEKRERENVLNEARKPADRIEANKNTEVKDSPKKLNVTKGLVTGRAAFFESTSGGGAGKSRQDGKQSAKDPAEMSLKERMALFEKIKGVAPVPKPPTATPAASIPSTSAIAKPVLISKAAEEVKKPRPQPGGYNQATKAESKAAGDGIKTTVAALLAGGATISENSISQETKKQRQQEMELLLNRFHQVQKSDSENEGVSLTTEVIPPPPPPPQPSTFFGTGSKRRSDGENGQEDSADEVKRVKKHTPKSPKNTGRLYPNISDLESTESDQNCTTASVSEEDLYEQKKKRFIEEEESSAMESEDADNSSLFEASGSISRAVLNSIRSANSSRMFSTTQPVEDSSSDDQEGGDDDMDEYLNEALDVSSGSSKKNTPRKSSLASNSFSYKRNSVRFEEPLTSTVTVSPGKSPRTTGRDNDDVVTLVHTVSFYRKQQGAKSSASPKKIIRREPIQDSTTTESEETDTEMRDRMEMHRVEEKINRLTEEMQKQQTIICQASKALHLCSSRFEFEASTEAAEAERVLLMATERRQAILSEIQRLRVDGSLIPKESSQYRGKITVEDITLPLKQEYITRLSTKSEISGISGHYLVCLLKYNETVLATEKILTLAGLCAVKFPTKLQMNDVYDDCVITLEIYGMPASKDNLPHELKYHITPSKKVKSSKIRTPKSKKYDNSMVMLPVQSPGGLNVILTPSMVLLGSVYFRLKDIGRTAWTLNTSEETLRSSPLQGIVKMKITGQSAVPVEYSDFLSMFEDVSGLGDWKRRWFRLKDSSLSYWKYPDDYKKKPAMGHIDLYSCCSEKVAPAPRHVSTRMNTLMLELKRPSRETDVESLVLFKRGGDTIVRYLLSADTSKDRDKWIDKLNKALTVTRSWPRPAAD